jgi:hypothetical protein
VDANHPVIRIQASGERAFELSATVEMWRTEPRTIKTQTSDLFKQLGAPDPFPTVVSPDHLVQVSDDCIGWCHHNERREHDGYEINLRLQGLGEWIDRSTHPLRGRTSGAVMRGEGMAGDGALTLQSSTSRQSHRLSIYVLTLHPSTIDEWRHEVERVMAACDAVEPSHARPAHELWWEEFWNRSWIEVSSAFEVTQAYVLQRFMNAAGGRGAQPIKFNGSIFSVGTADDPDFRRWGGPGFWFQNQRLIYCPMLAAGDLDLLRPWLAMYRDMLPLQQLRTRMYFGHGGAHYPETITFWGAEVSAHYGWMPFEQRHRPEAESPYIKYYWTCGLELTLILHALYQQTLDEAFAREFLVPIADAVIEFYDLHYPRDEAGRLRMEPSQSLETWQDATNPLPDLAGLHYTLHKLLELPPSLVTNAQRDRWRRLRATLPPVPIGEKNGQRVLLPAEQFDKRKNTENPELYAIFPFRLYGVGKADLQLARDTFAARLHKSHECWSQDDIQAACLGLTAEAKENIVRRAAPATHSRFPAFWDAHHDWAPDMDHGGVLQLALQSMLMQTESRKIILFPAWPMEWDVTFKLHAPYHTVVEGVLRNGEVAELQVSPSERHDDVVIWPKS